MTDVQDRILAELQMLNGLLAQLRDRTVSGKHVQVITGLSEISNRLGLIMAGEFRAGNGVEPGKGFSGVRLTSDGISAYNNDLETIRFDLDGDAFFGNNLSLPANVSIIIFSNNQTYNGELVGAGDVLYGDNSATKPNLFWDSSAGVLQTRNGTTVIGRMGANEMLAGLGAKVRRVATQSIPNATYTDIEFDTEVFDEGSFVDLVSSNTRITLPDSGYYTVMGFAQFAANGTGFRELRPARFDSGGGQPANPSGLHFAAVQAVSNGGTTMEFVFEVYADANDYLQMNTWQNSGGNLNLVNALLSVRRVR